VKRKDLIKQLHAFGWELLREGASHSIFTNGVRKVTVPRHKEINENTARSILKEAKEGKR